MASGFTLGNTIRKRMGFPPLASLSFLFYPSFTAFRTVTVSACRPVILLGCQPGVPIRGVNMRRGGGAAERRGVAWVRPAQVIATGERRGKGKISSEPLKAVVEHRDAQEYSHRLRTLPGP